MNIFFALLSLFAARKLAQKQAEHEAITEQQAASQYAPPVAQSAQRQNLPWFMVEPQPTIIPESRPGVAVDDKIAEAIDAGQAPLVVDNVIDMATKAPLVSVSRASAVVEPNPFNPKDEFFLSRPDLYIWTGDQWATGDNLDMVDSRGNAI